MELERKKILLIRAGCWILYLTAAYLALRWLFPFLLPFITGFAVAFALRPATDFICRHSKVSRRYAAIMCAVIFYMLIIGACWLFAALSMMWLKNTGENLPQLYADKIEPALSLFNDKLLLTLNRFFPKLNGARFDSSVSDFIGSVFNSASVWGAGLLARLVKSVPMSALTLVFTMLSTILICADYNGVTGFVMRQVPARLHTTVIDVRNFIVRSIVKILKTYLILMVITFMLLAFGFWVLKIDGFIIYAAIIALLDLLPVLGSGAVLIPWGIVLIVMGESFTGIGMFVLWAFSAFVREFIEPKILGGQIGLHPLATLTAMYLGLKLAGFGGLILAPVICLLLRYLQDNGIIKLYNKPSDSINIE